MKIKTEVFKEFLDSAVIKGDYVGSVFLKFLDNGIKCEVHNAANTNFVSTLLKVGAIDEYDKDNFPEMVGIVSPDKLTNHLNRFGKDLEVSCDEVFLILRSGKKELKTTMADKDAYKELNYTPPSIEEASGAKFEVDTQLLTEYVNFAKIDEEKDYIFETVENKLLIKTDATYKIKQEVDIEGIEPGKRVRVKEPFVYALEGLRNKKVKVCVETNRPLIFYHDSDKMEIHSVVAPIMEEK